MIHQEIPGPSYNSSPHSPTTHYRTAHYADMCSSRSESPIACPRPRARTLDAGTCSNAFALLVRHNRSKSYRFNSRTSCTDDLEDSFEDIGDFFRPRVSTMPTSNVRRPNMDHEEATMCNSMKASYLMRNFSTNDRGQVVNRGDFWREGSRSNTSVCSSCSTKSSPPTSGPSVSTCNNSGGGEQPYRVMVLGDAGVGKSALVAQFMTSEYVNAYEFSQEDEDVKPVSILLDGEEFYLCFIDNDDSATMWSDAQLADLDAEAYLIVYSVTSRASYDKAVDLMYTLRGGRSVGSANLSGENSSYNTNKPIILVANKCDLVRTREVTAEEAKSTACAYDSKYAEISAGLKHNVDELLVGIVAQIRLKLQQQFERYTHLIHISRIGTDASNVVAGACLVQLDDAGRKRPIAFANYKFSQTERRWSTIEREAFAVVWALRKFDTWLFGVKVHLVSDHNPHAYLTKTTPGTAKLIRWALSLQRYDVSISHRSGSSNGNADVLSRLVSEE